MPTKPKARKAGRPAFQPTEEQRYTVSLMAAIGIPQEDMCPAIGVTRPTLRKHFKEELAVGKTKAITQVAGSLMRQALDGNVTAQIFFLKTRAGWKETEVVENKVTVNEQRTEVPDRALDAAATALKRSGFLN